jgi:hypothetical protein
VANTLKPGSFESGFFFVASKLWHLVMSGDDERAFAFANRLHPRVMLVR